MATWAWSTKAADKVYRYMNFDQIKEYAETAEGSRRSVRPLREKRPRGRFFLGDARQLRRLPGGSADAPRADCASQAQLRNVSQLSGQCSVPSSSRRWMPWSVLGTAADPVRHLVPRAAGRADQRVVRHLLRPGAERLFQAGASRRRCQLGTSCHDLRQHRAMVYVTVAVLLDFFIKHYVFRWRQAMNDYYMKYWERLRVDRGRGAAGAGGHDALRPHHGGPGRGPHAQPDDAGGLPADPVGACRTRSPPSPSWGHPAFAGLGVDRLGAVRHRAAGGHRHPAAGTGVPEPARGGGLPQGAGVRRGRPSRAAPPVAARCSRTCGATTSACSSTTCTSTW